MCVSECQIVLRPVGDQRQRQQRQRRHQAEPREQIEHRHPVGPPQQQIADREDDRRDHQHGKGANAEIETDGAADHQQADRGDADPGDLHARRNLAKRQRGERHREQRLALHDHAGKSDRNAFRDRPGLRQELSEKQRAANRGQEPPGDVRLAHEQARHRRDGKTQRRHQRGRELVERQPGGNESKAPDQRHQNGETNVGRLHP